MLQTWWGTPIIIFVVIETKIENTHLFVILSVKIDTFHAFEVQSLNSLKNVFHSPVFVEYCLQARLYGHPAHLSHFAWACFKLLIEIKKKNKKTSKTQLKFNYISVPQLVTDQQRKNWSLLFFRVF